MFYFLQILFHLWGDYIFQTDWMANYKAKQWKPVIYHAVTYTIPFLFLTRNPLSLAIIGGTHLLIDHYRLAKYVVQFKNGLTDKERWKKFDTTTGFAEGTPDYISWTLFVISDNILHLTINFLTLQFLH